MTALPMWRRGIAVAFALASLAIVLYALGAPIYQGG
jgi:hypothetical protein